MGWLSAVTMILTALAFVVTAAVSVLTYRQARKTHTLVNGARQTTNDLVTKIAYFQGRQDVLLNRLEFGPESPRDPLPPDGA